MIRRWGRGSPRGRRGRSCWPCSWPSGDQTTRSGCRELATELRLPGVPGAFGRRQPGADVAGDPGRHQGSHRRVERRRIRQAYVDRYGQSILLSPLTPASGSSCGCSRLVFVLGAGGSASCCARWPRAASAATEPTSAGRARAGGPSDIDRTRRGARVGTRLLVAVARRPRARARERQHRRRVVRSGCTTTTPRRPDVRALRDGVDARPFPRRPCPADAGHRRDRGIRGRCRRRARGGARCPPAR